MNYKGIRIIKKPSFCNFIPGISWTAQAIYPYILVPERIFQKLDSKYVEKKLISILEHERMHIIRQKQLGFLIWAIKYVFSSKFRVEEEFLAIEQSIKYLKHQGLNFDIEKYSQALSSWIYLWPISYSEAKNRLLYLWRKEQ